MLGGSPTTRHAPLLPTTASTSDSDEEAAPAPASTPTARTREVERQVAALRQRVDEGDDAHLALEAALAAAQHDSQLVAQRLHTQLAAKTDECSALTELVFHLRQEADTLRSQLATDKQAALHADVQTAGSLAQLQEAAAEWRRQGEDSLSALAAECQRSAALQADVARAGAEAEVLRRELAAERAAREGKEAQLAALHAQEGGPALVAELRCAMERAWRKAVTEWLRGELKTKTKTKADLERVLLNVGMAACVGAGPGSDGGRAGRAPAPPLPPHPVAASQMGHGAPATVTVTVTHEHIESGGGGGNDSSPTIAAMHTGENWRQHLKAALAAFDGHHAELKTHVEQHSRLASQ